MVSIVDHKCGAGIVFTRFSQTFPDFHKLFGHLPLTVILFERLVRMLLCGVFTFIIVTGFVLLVAGMLLLGLYPQLLKENLRSDICIFGLISCSNLFMK